MKNNYRIKNVNESLMAENISRTIRIAQSAKHCPSSQLLQKDNERAVRDKNTSESE